MDRWHLGGIAVGFAVTFSVLVPVTTRLTRRYPGRTRWPDQVLGIVITLVWMIAVTTLCDELWSDAPGFADAVVSGVGIAPVVFLPDILAALRHRRRPEAVRPAIPVVRPRRPGRFVSPTAFSPAVHRHFADPAVRARYVIATYRRGLIPAEQVPVLAADLAPLLSDGAAWAELAAHDGGSGLEGTVDRAAREIDYGPTSEEERDDAVERLVYTALCSTDPMVRLATVRLLAPADGLRVPAVSNPPATMSVTRATIVGFFDAVRGVVLTDGVRRHFADPTVRARRLIAAYRRGEELSRDVGRIAADLIADLPGAGPAWTELAIAGPDASRSDVDDVVERAAAEIGHRAADETDLLIEHELYRALRDGDVLDRSQRIFSLEARSPFAAPFILAGHDGDVGITTFVADGAAYLERKCST